MFAPPSPMMEFWVDNPSQMMERDIPMGPPKDIVRKLPQNYGINNRLPVNPSVSSTGLLGSNRAAGLIEQQPSPPKELYSKEQFNDIKKLLTHAEGHTDYYYLDTKDNWTSGIGDFHSEKADNKFPYTGKIGKRTVATDKNGKILRLKKTDIDKNFKKNVDVHYKDAKDFFGSNIDFESLPMKMKTVLTSISFTSGKERLKAYTGIKKAVENFATTGEGLEDIALEMIYVDPTKKNPKLSSRFIETGGSGARVEKEFAHMLTE